MFEGVKKFWEGLTNREKIALGVVVAGVAGYALYVRYKSGNSQNMASSVQPSVDQNGVPLNGTDLNGVFSTVPGTGTGTTGTPDIGTPITPVLSHPPGPTKGPPQPTTTPKYITVVANQSFNTLGALYHNYPSAIKALNPGYASFANHDILPVGTRIRVL